MTKRGLVILTVITYLIMLFGGAMLKPGYSHFSQYISELNATGTPFADTIGWLGFVPFGLSALALWAVTAKYAPVSGASRLGYWLLLAEPIAYIGSAFAPCDVGCPGEGSLSQGLHNLLGLCTYLATTFGLFLLSFTPGLKAPARIGWILLAAVWFGLFALMLDGSLAAQRGILQRSAEWIVYSTLLVIAWRLPEVGSARLGSGGGYV